MRRKILHVVGGMTRGGVETWLMHLMRNMDRSQFESHFLVAAEQEMPYDQEIIALGGRIHRGARPKNLPSYAKRFAAVNRDCGPFAAVHSHVYWYSGFVTRLGYELGIPIRIAHSHSASGAPAWKLHRRTYQALMRRMIMRYATHRIAASPRAAEALFGHRPQKSVRLIRCGMDFTRFLQRPPIGESKRRLGISPERKVIGHVGRFVPVKNHAFLLDTFERTLQNGMDAHLLLVGDGPLLAELKAKVEARALSSRCTFAGTQPDVVPFFSAMDVFVFPSLWEGLGLVALESQAAGVPVIASTGVPEDVNAIPGLVERIPLAARAENWASVVSRTLRGLSQRTGDEPLLLQHSRFGLPMCLEALSRIYRGDNSDDSVG